MMRAGGEAAGVTGILMNQETVDMYNPKVIRSTMGALYHMPFVYTDHLADTLKELEKRRYPAVCRSFEGGSVPMTGKATLRHVFIGNEANGLSREVASLADTYIKIPMRGQVESLNAAVAASVLAFEAARQRRNLTK